MKIESSSINIFLRFSNRHCRLIKIFCQILVLDFKFWLYSGLFRIVMTRVGYLILFSVLKNSQIERIYTKVSNGIVFTHNGRSLRSNKWRVGTDSVRGQRTVATYQSESHSIKKLLQQTIYTFSAAYDNLPHSELFSKIFNIHARRNHSKLY